MHTCLISFIIPVYNTEIESFKRCINSIKKISDISYEIIVIDDGSNDDNSQLYFKFLNDNLNINIKYFKNNNFGVSYSRNYGIEKSNGKYIMFVDSDDEVLPKSFDNIDLLNDYDYIINDYCVVMKNNTIIENKVSDFSQELNYYQLLNIAFGTTNINGPYAKFYNTSFVKKNGILFDTSMNQGEDIYFNILMILSKPKTIYTGIKVYAYYFDGNNTLKRWINSFDKTLNSINILYKKEYEVAYGEDKSICKRLLKIIDNVCVNTYKQAYSIMVHNNKNENLTMLSNGIKQFNINPRYLKFKHFVFYFLIKNNYKSLFKLIKH